MQKPLFCLFYIFFFSCFLLRAQPSIQWAKCFGGSFFDSGESIQQTTDGGYIIAGTSQSFDGDVTENHGANDYWIVKISSLGVIQWQKSLGGSDPERAYSIQQTSDNGYIVSGASESNDGDVTGHHGSDFESDYWVIKLDTLGTIPLVGICVNACVLANLDLRVGDF